MTYGQRTSIRCAPEPATGLTTYASAAGNAARAICPGSGKSPMRALHGGQSTYPSRISQRCAENSLEDLFASTEAAPGTPPRRGFDDSLQARQAIQAVMERLDGTRSERREIVLPPALITRRTTGPAPRTSRAEPAAGIGQAPSCTW